MMKKITYLSVFLLLLGLISCQNSSKFTISGSFINGQPSEEWIYFSKVGKSNSLIDSAHIENGKFTYSGNIELPEIFVAHYHPSKVKGVASFFLEPGKLNLTINLNNWYNSTIDGGAVNKELIEYQKSLDQRFFKQIAKLNQENANLPDEQKKDCGASLKSVFKANKNYCMEYVKEHSSSYITPYIIYYLAPRLTKTELRELLNSLSPELHKAELYKQLNQRLS